MRPNEVRAPAQITEQLLSQSEERFRLLVAAVKDYAIYMLDPEGIVVSWNEGAQRAKGYTASEIIGQSLAVFYTPEDRAKNRPLELLKIANEMGSVEDEGWRVRKDGTRFWADVVITAIRDSQNRLLGYAKVTRDLTERKQAEEQLLAKQVKINKLQRMEALGRLTGGIAHDFNNLVAGILGCAESLEETVVEPEAQEEARAIKMACGRASELVRQLMAFSRRQMAAPKPIQVNELIRNIAQLMRRSLPANIQLVIELSPDIPLISADPGQIDQILVNLILNARDAMPQGGPLTLHSERVWVDELTLLDGFPERPANAVMISVSDVGTGIPKDIQEKIFEPFFTTKEAGKGTGLGLSTVHGIVQQNKGGLSLFSMPGFGTTMKIFLPLGSGTTDSVDSPQSHAPIEPLRGGNELILVVEDEPLVLRNTVRTLQAQGYSVLSAGDAEEGLKLFRRTQGKLRMIISDVVMPGRSGKELAKIVEQEDPSVSILFISGYAPEIIATHGLLTGEIDFLEKPFSASSLLKKVHEILHCRR